jgi:hypothetical protein
MSDYVVYHKAEKMGYAALDIDNLGVYTKKDAENALGKRVWVIAGEGAPRNYFLRGTFRVGAVESSDRPDFKYRIKGTDGQLLDPMPALDEEPWFRGFLEAQGRFAFGLNPIGNTSVESSLREILHANTLRE